jgi:hypothetical protein
VEGEDDRYAWSTLSLAGKCAMRWRGAIRIAAHLRLQLPFDQLKTLRYEDMIADPRGAAAALSEFAGATVAAPVMSNHKKVRSETGSWRHTLTMNDIAEVEKVAGEELRRLAYG